MKLCVNVVLSFMLVHIVDWLPTLVGLAGGQPGRLETDGEDVWAALTTGQDTARDILGREQHQASLA